MSATARATPRPSAGRPAATPPRRRHVEIVSDWLPSSAFQLAVLQSVERYIDGFAGRRTGKSDVIFPWLTGLHAVWEPGQRKWGAIWLPGERFLYTAPQRNPNCIDFHDKLKRVFGAAGLLKDHNDTDLWCKLFNDTEIECKSTERPDNLRGPGYAGIASDEICTTPQAAYKVLRPTLSDPSRGFVRRWLRVGSPQGKRHWTYKRYLAGQKGNSGPLGHVSFRFPTSCRPGMEAEIEQARLEYTEAFFRQEYECEFLDDAASFFDLVDAAHDGEGVPDGPEGAFRHVAGVDFGHADDFTVVAILRVSRLAGVPHRLVCMLRWPGKTPWPLTKARIVEALRKWDAGTLVDATPGGAPSDVVVDSLAAADPETGAPGWSRVEGIDFTKMRAPLLKNLSIALSTKRVRLPGTKDRPAYPALKAELEGFEVDVGANGRPRGKAGEDLDDDTVMALALATWAADNGVADGYATIRHWQ